MEIKELHSKKKSIIKDIHQIKRCVHDGTVTFDGALNKFLIELDLELDYISLLLDDKIAWLRDNDG